MLDIWGQIIFIPENIDELPDLKYIFNKRSYSMEGAKMAIDGSLIKKPINYLEGSTFFDRKSQYSINVMFLFDSNCNIRNIYANKPGSTNDKRVYNDSWLCANINNILPNNNYILGDSGYTLRNKLLTPYSRSSLSNDSQCHKRLYNKVQSSARMAAERGIGRIKQRFKKLMNGLHIYRGRESVRFIVAAAVFHQMLLNIEDSYDIDISINVNNEGEEEELSEVTENRETFRDMIATNLFNKHLINY